MGKGIREICKTCRNLKSSEDIPFCSAFLPILKGEVKINKCKEYVWSNRPLLKERKYCSHCGRIKPLSSFYKESRYKDGYYPICRECKSLISKTYIMTREFKPDTGMYVIARVNESGGLTCVERQVEEGKERARRVFRSYVSNHPFSQYKLLKVIEQC